jgi:hypothetical protein
MSASLVESEACFAAYSPQWHPRFLESLKSQGCRNIGLDLELAAEGLSSTGNLSSIGDRDELAIRITFIGCGDGNWVAIGRRWTLGTPGTPLDGPRPLSQGLELVSLNYFPRRPRSFQPRAQPP